MRSAHLPRLFVLAFLLASPALLRAGPRDAQWKEVDEAAKKGLPKTAIEKLEPIIAGARQDKAWAELVKAIGKKIAFEGNIEGNKPEERITRLQAELAKATDETRPVMETLLAHWYWHYFQQNRWRFMQRTQTAEPPGKDFTTWDLPRILGEIDKHFAAALAAEKRLQAIPIAAWDDLLIKGNVPDTYRPTLYDFLAQEALQFYSAGEQGAAAAEDEFEFDAASPVLAPVPVFLKWLPDSTTAEGDAPSSPRPHGAGQGKALTEQRPPSTPGAESRLLKAIRLYQKLLAFHQADPDRSAFLDVDLHRLQFGQAELPGEEKTAAYKKALERFVGEWADHEIAARALCGWANVLQGEGDMLGAHKLAQRGWDTYPNSVGGRMCFNLLQQLEAKSAALTTESVWNEPWPTLDVRYRNVTKVWFRAVPYDFEAFITTTRWGWGGFNAKERDELLAKEPAQAWSADLPPTTDYVERLERLPAPRDLKPGFYMIVASHDESFKEPNNVVSFSPVWVSELALVMRQRNNSGIVEGFVLKARSGDPIAGAAVQSYVRNNEGWLKPGDTTKTDADGLFRFDAGQRPMLLIAEVAGQKLATGQEFWASKQVPLRPYAQTVFFTDRSLYRPGQTIQYKGICLQVDQENNKYESLAEQTFAVVLRDANGQEIGRQQHKSNAYGSFNGSFIAPRDRATGRLMLFVENGPHGNAWVNVEEYKRPKFRVELEAPKEAAKLGARVVVQGKASSYTGAPIGGAKVQYRITRGVTFPLWWRWCGWSIWPQSNEAKAIAHGRAVTDNDGSFKIEFVAAPDLAVPEKQEPTFTFTVHADVTDTTGETRSDDSTVRAGYTALQASLAAEEWLTTEAPVTVTVATQSLDGRGQAAAGRVKIHKLKQPATVLRGDLGGHQPHWPVAMRHRGASGKHLAPEPKPDPADPNTWELGEVVNDQEFKTDDAGTVKLTAQLPAGIYRAMLETKDRFGKAVTARLPLQVVDLKAKQFGVKVPYHFAAAKDAVEPGQSYVALWGTGYEQGRAYVELEHRGKVLRRWWTAADRTQEVIEQAVTEEMRGGFTLRLTYVRENRAYLENQVIKVPWSNKQLALSWEHFTSKLMPAQKETWSVIVAGPDAKRAAAEMVAGLYDASLDAYLPHQWLQAFNVFRSEPMTCHVQFENRLLGFNQIMMGWRSEYKDASLNYRYFPTDLTVNLWGYAYFGRQSKGMALSRGLQNVPPAPGAPMAAMAAEPMLSEQSAKAMDANGMAGLGGGKAEARKRAGVDKSLREVAKGDEAEGGGGGGAAAPDLGKVAARKNLQETAFFFPQLTTDEQGTVKMEFTMPEALTEWKFMGFAHDRELRSGFLQDKVVTAKDLMVEPNPPRFLREGDSLEFTVKVTNQSAERQTGKVRLTLADARTLQPMDTALGNAKPELAFDIPAKESRSFAWRLTVPDGADFLTYKAVGATAKLSDGEEGYLPVLSRRILVTESLPLPIRGKQTKQFEFAKLVQSGKSRTLRHENLTVQMVSQPAWYAVMALPYLMEFPHECSEQVFNRLYANALARYIAATDPKIRRIFDLWKGTPALDSPLQKNQELKSVMLEETPWLQQALDENQARKNVGILFDDNRLNDETARTLRQLADMQCGDGLWPWFPGGMGNEYITLYITTGFGRLRQLGVDVPVASAVKSLAKLDAWVDEQYRWILAHGKKEENHLNYQIAFYLYGRSFFLKDQPLAGAPKEAVDYYLGQAKQYWLQLDCRQSQGHLAVALQRFGDKETAVAIMKSIKERSVTNEEMGMFWRDTEASWWWYRAPIETQAMMVEAFTEVMDDAAAVENCKVWLLKQKQTQDWKTTKATADAVYALLVRGANLLTSDALVEVSLAGHTIKPEKVEAGTGFYEQKFARGEIRPEMGRITVKKVDDGVSWGSVHWQYLEDMTKVTPYEGTPLKLKKAIFIKDTTKKGQVLKPVTGPVAVGDELVVRVELRVDRDMEYVHLKDQRGSGTEPVNVLSQYKFQDGLRYYESTKDTASHFFIDYLPKGVYVFEYSTRVQHRGAYQTGMANIQCMYAPEFNSHSESFGLEVK